MKSRLPRRLLIVAAVLFLLFFILALGLSTPGVVFQGIVSFDQRTNQAFSSLRHNQLVVHFMIAMTTLGSPEAIIVFEIIHLPIAVLLRRRGITLLFLAG